MDFLILLALHMDANRNYENYLREENTKIDLFLEINIGDNLYKKKKLTTTNHSCVFWQTPIRIICRNWDTTLLNLSIK